jgi:hypothetical protein
MTCRYDGYINPNITDTTFPHLRKGAETVTIDLVKFDQSGTTAERELQLAAYGDLADMDDMLWTGASHPDKQRQYPIVFLGAAWVRSRRNRDVGCLWSGDSGRGCALDGGHPGRRWSPDCVFAVRRRK